VQIYTNVKVVTGRIKCDMPALRMKCGRKNNCSMNRPIDRTNLETKMYKLKIVIKLGAK